MKTLKFKKIDAFTGTVATGNPAACIYLEDGPLPEDDMLQIARQLKGFVNEVAFLHEEALPGGDALYSLRYYSSECEVAFCGHATVACMYDLIKNNAGLARQECIPIQTAHERLLVINDIQNSDSVFITAPDPVYLPLTVSADALCAHAEISHDLLDAALPVEIIDGGLRTLLVPIRSLPGCVQIAPDIHLLRDFCVTNEIDIILVFTGETVDARNRFRTRVFAPKYGYLEDPATGSGNAAFGYYLLKNKLWDGSTIAIEQGTDLEHPNIVKINAGSGPGTNRKVAFGGRATVRIEGSYYLW